ncbi:hypothetical protein TYRP_018640 [Tyrophagus putrescentiae]|nr:hypothetical protein TYRP_018640 [Tyrophagus putrescentiae]
MKYNFTGKSVLVTGSSSGIGEAIAKRFAEYGANVTVTGRNADNVARVAAACYQISPYKIRPQEVIADLTIEADAKRLVKDCVDRFGRLDVLVNNAGFALITSILDPQSLTNFDKVSSLDVRSVVNVTLLATPHLIESKGNIVNISSICGLKPLAGFYAYCMAKASVDMFTKCIALELGPSGVRVNSINSGGVKSNFFNAIGMTKEQVAAQEEMLRSSSPINLLGEPTDIADMVIFVCSNDAKYITGSNLVVDGGTLHSALAVAK